MKTIPCTEKLVKVYAFSNAPKCGAKTRSGLLCKSPAVRFKKRCRMHGGTNHGAPTGNHNALKHGFNITESKYLKKRVIELLRDCKQLLAKY